MHRKRSINNGSRINQASRRRQFGIGKLRLEQEDELTLRGNNMQLTVGQDGRKYYESELKQEDQKYIGWYWCSDRKAFYRWNDLIGKDEV